MININVKGIGSLNSKVSLLQVELSAGQNISLGRYCNRRLKKSAVVFITSCARNQGQHRAQGRMIYRGKGQVGGIG